MHPALLTCIALVMVAPAAAQTFSYEAGLPGAPPVAPSPTSQGWSLSTNGGVGLFPISPDPVTAVNAWEVSDNSPTGFAMYQRDLPFAPQGWEATIVLRMTAGPSRTIRLELSLGDTLPDPSLILDFTVVGSDIVLFHHGGSFVCPGLADDRYHTFTMRLDASLHPYSNAQVLCDGTFVGLATNVGNGGAGYFVKWGASSSTGIGRARIHRVEFRMFDDRLGAAYCTPATPNSSGGPAYLWGRGSMFASANDFRLDAIGVPPNQFGYFLASRTPGAIQPPGSQGTLCVAGNIGRFTSLLQNTGPLGRMLGVIDLTAIPVNPPAAAMAQETWYFQAWFRDANPGATSNFTNGLEVTWN